VTVDGLVADELALYGGSEKTPALEALSAEGHVWNDAWTAIPQTRPAVATYLTGLAPDRHGVRDDRLSSLGADTPTLATALGAAGYRTAAFPDSSFLGTASGLLRGFEVVDDPPISTIGPIVPLPQIRPASTLADAFESWIATVGADEPLFAWIHASGPMLGQMHALVYGAPAREPGTAAGGEGEGEGEREGESADAGPPTSSVALERFDGMLARVVEALRARGRWERAVVAVVATVGDVSGDEGELVGPGYSIAPRAVRVPLVIRWPAAAPGRTDVAWGPDVAVTLATLAGVELAGAEGRDLRAETAADRPRFVWSWATRDQMGWLALRGVRAGDLLRVEGLAPRTERLAGTGPVDAGEEARLTQALAARAEPELPSVDWTTIRSLLDSRGLEIDAVPPGGRPFGDGPTRSAVARDMWEGWIRLWSGEIVRGAEAYRRALAVDRENLGALLCLGQLEAMGGEPEAMATMERAVELYPSHPGTLHWYAHAIWSQSWQDAEKLLEAILPLEPHDADLLYDLACTRSLAGDTEASAARLRQAIEAGYRAWQHIETDSDLRALRESRRFAEVMREYGR
jgi:hypothetical protein